MVKVRKKKKMISSVKHTEDTIDIILYEIRDLRKEMNDLKTFVNKSKGTVAVLVFMATIVATVVGAWNYLVK